MKKEFDENNLPEDKKEEILARMNASREAKKLKKAKQKAAGKRESSKRKELIRFANQKNVQFFEAYSLARGGYKTLCGYVPPVRVPNQKIDPIVDVAYAISCCSPTDKYDMEKGKLIVLERLRNGNATILSYRKSRIPFDLEDKKLPMMIDLDLIRTAVTGINTSGANIPQVLIDLEPNG